MIKQEEVKKRFESEYEESTKEILILADDSGVGAGGLGNGYWKPMRDFLAYVDLETGELREGRGSIVWCVAEEEGKSPDWIHNLESETIYKLRVREKKHKGQGEETRFTNQMMLVEVVERNVSNAALEAVLKEYQKPVVIKDETYGDFVLEKQYGWFQKSIEALGHEFEIYLEVDEDNAQIADGALKTFHKIFEDIEGWDKAVKAYAAKMLTESANDWLVDSCEEEETVEEIKEEDFTDNIWLESITISPEGSFEAYYNDGDMFWGHVIIVSGQMEEKIIFKDADIAG